MKKLLVIALSILLVMGFSAVGFAASVNDSVGVNVTVQEYFDVWFETPNDYDGLFGGDILGEAGIYISDGGTTQNSVLSNDYWGGIGATSADVITDYNTGEAMKYVELFKVDANTNVEVTLSADWTGWMNAPTIFRISSNNNKKNPDSNNPDVNGIGTWATDLAVIGNSKDANGANIIKDVANEEYNDIIEHHRENLPFEDSFTLLFGDDYICHGPLDFHVNGALWLPKISQVAADDYTATVIVTVAATDN